MDIKIIVATHKPYWMPSDPVYMPLRVGCIGKDDFGYTGDHTGSHISEKNASFCELTGLYWAWKNLRADYIGLVHYRRHFSSGKHFGNKQDRVIDRSGLEKALEGVDVLVAKQRHYWIETNYSQYAHAHHAIDLDVTREIINEKYPDYTAAFDASMKRTHGHRFNLFVMKYPLFCQYCAWLFDILFELESRLDTSQYNANDARVFGFVSERLMDVWLETNHIAYRELPYVFMETQNWLVKGGKFLKRKISAVSKTAQR